MSHCIEVKITKEKQTELCFRHEDVFIYCSNTELEQPYVKASTNFFGGFGDHYATFNGKEYDDINKALEDFGIKKKDKYQDLFEHCGLDLFRDNRGLDELIYEQI